MCLLGLLNPSLTDICINSYNADDVDDVAGVDDDEADVDTGVDDDCQLLLPPTGSGNSTLLSAPPFSSAVNPGLIDPGLVNLSKSKSCKSNSP